MPASILEEVGHLLGAALTRGTATRLTVPSCGFASAARVLGADGTTHAGPTRRPARS